MHMQQQNMHMCVRAPVLGKCEISECLVCTLRVWVDSMYNEEVVAVVAVMQYDHDLPATSICRTLLVYVSLSFTLSQSFILAARERATARPPHCLSLLMYPVGGGAWV